MFATENVRDIPVPAPKQVVQKAPEVDDTVASPATTSNHKSFFHMRGLYMQSDVVGIRADKEYQHKLMKVVKDKLNGKKINKVAPCPDLKSKYLHSRLVVMHAKEKRAKWLEEEERKKRMLHLQSLPKPKPACKPVALCPLFVIPEDKDKPAAPVYQDATTTIYFYDGRYSSVPPPVKDSHNFNATR